MRFIFFDIIDGEDLPDLKGSEHADLAAARIASRYGIQARCFARCPNASGMPKSG